MGLVKDFSKIAGGSFVNLLIGLLTTPLITRMVEPEQYGNWSLFIIYGNVLSSILLMGTDYIIVRYYYENDSKSYKYLLTKWCFLTSIVAVLLSCVPIAIVIKLIRPCWSVLILILLVLSILTNVVNRLVGLLLRFENSINVLSLTTVLQKVLFVAIAITSLYCITGFNFEMLSIASLVSSVITVSVCLFFLSRLRTDVKKAGVICSLPKKEMLKYGFPLMISGCSYLLFQATDKLVIGQYCSEADLGIYSSAASFLSLFGILQSSFSTIWWPTVMRNYERNHEDKLLYVKANDMVCFIMVVVGVTFILFKDVLILLLGEHFRGAVVVIPFIIFQPILYTISETTVLGLNFQKKSKTQLYITVSSLIFNIFLNIILTKLYGIVGTSVAVGLSYIFFLTVRTFASHRYYNIPFHFARMFISVLLLFVFAFMHTLMPRLFFTYISVLFIYAVLLIMYRDVIYSLYLYFRKLTESVFVSSNSTGDL